ncbi:beta-carotene 15,15'-monooxygenase [Streptococcus sp. HMSC10A01]|uniref:TraX family protein n=1 Tax=Streptococcus sp. HMSC10A01 TaxID=1581076 RepID=UPI0008A36462|nr:TraX family protein [Streptococcus sp. HMSC10A01]OFU69344.1 beta-carotene 15,15'-monooxygenase [Streptococcus sp. HMSC10A01]
MKKGNGLNGFQIKLIMALLMVLDHVDKIPGLLPVGWDGIFHAVTRCVGVWFAFAAVEGFIHTRNRITYNLRLFFWAGLMFFGNVILNFLLQSKEIHNSNNIFLTLACGVLSLGIFFGFSKEKLELNGRDKWIRYGLGAVVFLVAAFLTEGGMVMIPFMLITYGYRKNEALRNLLYLALAVLLFVMSIEVYPSLSETLSMMLYNSDWLFITVLPFLYLYNGERGYTSKWSKYFFYIFYPAHLWLIALIAFWVK